MDSITFGTWQLGGARFGFVSNEDALGLLRKSIDVGVANFDTSNVYGNGRAQVLLGHVLREVPDRGRVRVTAKVGYLTGIDGFQDVASEFPQDFGESAIRRGLEESLSRLQTNYVDDLLLHDPSTEVVRDARVWRVLDGLRSEGTVRSIGLSTVPKKVSYALEFGADVVQIPVFHGQDMPKLEEALSACHQNGVRVMARSVLQGGKLLRGYDRSREETEARISELVTHALRSAGVCTAVVGVMCDRDLETLQRFAESYDPVGKNG